MNRVKPRARGFSYLELMVATLVVALCAIPAANAVRNGIDAGRVGQDKARELRCIRNYMETVLAEPYANLSDAVDGTRSYALPADATCGARNVTIERVEFDGTNVTLQAANALDVQKELALLRVKATLAGSPYTFTTVVAR